MQKCRYYGSAAGCCYQNKCNYSHDNPNSVPFCKYYRSSNGCNRNNKCYYRHTIFDESPTQETPNKLSASVVKFMLVHGYVREQETIVFQTVPKPITNMIANFFPWFAFDIFTIGTEKAISNYGKTFNTRDIAQISSLAFSINAGSSIGVKYGIWEINLIYVNNLSFGITSDINNCKSRKYAHDYDKGKTYYAHSSGNAHQSQTLTSIFSHNRQWNEGNTIKMQLNSDDKIVEYYLNDVSIGKINIDSNLLYHPFICTSSLFAEELQLI